MNNLRNLIKSQILLLELIELEEQLSNSPNPLYINDFLVIKNIFITINNLVDLKKNEDDSLKKIISNDQYLMDLYSKHEDKFKCCKYLRNNLMGHLSDDLIDLSIKWNALFRIVPQNFNQNLHNEKVKGRSLYHLFVLETLLNSCVDESGKNILGFRGDIDFLINNKDLKLFMSFLHETIQASKEILEYQIDLLNKVVVHLDYTNLAELYAIAEESSDITFEKLKHSYKKCSK